MRQSPRQGNPSGRYLSHIFSLSIAFHISRLLPKFTVKREDSIQDSPHFLLFQYTLSIILMQGISRSRFYVL